MPQKIKSKAELLECTLRQTDTSWEHSEKAVYTVEALQKEIKEKLSPKKELSHKKSSE